MSNRIQGNHFHIIGEAVLRVQLNRADAGYQVIERGGITVTTIHCNLTHYGALGNLGKAFE